MTFGAGSRLTVGTSGSGISGSPRRERPVDTTDGLAARKTLACGRDPVFDEPMLLGIISDTHGLLRPEALDALTGVEHIIHAGDIGRPDIVPRLATIAPVTAIRGNVDIQTWARELPAWEAVTLASRTIYVIHDVADLDLDPGAAGFDMVIFGHSHMPKVETINDVLYLNPGSAGPRRFRLPITIATVELTTNPLRPKIRQIAE